jgi:hypothetical protein
VDGRSQAEAGKGQRLVPDPADPVFGLPWLLAFDAAPRMQDVVPGKADQMPWIREERRGGRGRLAEGRTEVRAYRAEPVGRGEPEVDLETGRQQKRA